MTGEQLRDVTGLADRIRRSAEHSPEGTHPARGPLISVAAVLTLLDGCPAVGAPDDDGPDLTIGQGLRLEDVREWTAEEMGDRGRVVSEFREFVRAMDIGIAIDKRTAGQVLLGIACGPDLSREQLGEIGRAWSREGQAELDRHNQRPRAGRCRNSTCRADRERCEVERGSHQLPCCAYCSGVGVESAHADGPAPQAGGS